ncbi:MAG: S-layer homology domain-containing protein [Firmicutes bacterium]|nr:S-layer homology domain-containing protein [Bacillota bacterium]
MAALAAGEDANAALTWSGLQEKMTAGGEITLTGNVVADADDVALVVPEGVTVTLNLNGKSIDRGLKDKQAVALGYVIKVEKNAKLIINDSTGSGKITGGNCSGDAGGVFVYYGECIMNGGSITENKATISAGVYVRDGKFTLNGGSITKNESNNAIVGFYRSATPSSFVMTGGEISNNKAAACSGVYFRDGYGTFTLSGGVITGNTSTSVDNGYAVWFNESTTDFTLRGDPVISGNTNGEGAAADVKMANLPKIKIVGSLEGAKIGIWPKSPDAAFTEGLPGNGDESNFFCDKEDYCVVLTQDGEAILGQAIPLAITKTWEDYSDAANARPDDLSVFIKVTAPETARNIAAFSIEASAGTGGSVLVKSLKDAQAWENAALAKMSESELLAYISGLLPATDDFKTEYTTEADGEQYDIWCHPTAENSLELYYLKTAYLLTTDRDAGAWVDNGDDTWTYEMVIPAGAESLQIWETVPEDYETEEGTEDAPVSVTVSGDSAAAELTNTYARVFPVTVIDGRLDKSEALPGETVTITPKLKSGYTFDRWQVLSGGAVLDNPNAYRTSFTMPAGNVVVQANYVKKSYPGGNGSGSGSDPSYGITLDVGDNGSAAVKPTAAREDETVTVTTRPDEGYEVEKVTATDRDGDNIPVKENGDGSYTFKMPAGKVKVAVTFKEKEQEHVCPSANFTDISENAWYHEAVDYVVEKGLMQGVSANRFDPNGTTNRAMIVTILYRLAGSPAVSEANPFSDVADGQWYADAVIWANANGIVEGYGNGKFGPNDNITREQMAAILYRYAKFKGYDVSVGEDTNILSYNDAFSISSWAMPAMQWACGAELMQGDEQHNLLPGQGATRAQAAAILMRFMENVK